MGGIIGIVLLAAVIAAGNVSAETRALHNATNTADRYAACTRLAQIIPGETQQKNVAARTPAADAAFDSLRDYVLNGTDRDARIKCARRLINFAVMISPQTSGNSTPYAHAAISVMYDMMKDPDPKIRSGAITALWGVPEVSVGRKLLEAARSDSSGLVRRSAFETMYWGMETDIRANNAGPMYESVIDSALKSNDAETVAGALSAYSGLNRAKADPLLRRYALDNRPVVRAGAIWAYDSMMEFNESIERFIESRLNDPDPNVRSEVLLRLLRMGDTHALPAIDRLAKTAPTAAERKEAQAYARSLREGPAFTSKT